MVILSHSGAQAIFAGIAQLIPVFLIALFVMDNAWPLKSIDQIKSDAATGIEQVKEQAKEHESAIKSAMEDGLRQLDGYVEHFDTPQARSQIAELKAKTRSAGDELLKQNKESTDTRLNTLSNRANGVIQGMETSARRRATTYARVTIMAIIPGMFGEIASLWGVVGLVDNVVVLALVVAVSVDIAGILSVLAIDRLIAQTPSKVLAILRAGWITVLFGITLTTFFWIMTSVQIKR